TALARYTIRAIAPRVLAPSELLSRLNEAILPQLAADMFCTVAYAHLELGEQRARVTFACGGHPLPFLLRTSGEVQMVGRPGMLVGASPLLTLTDAVVDLGPGDAMLFYTDGVLEARRGAELFGEDRLADAIQACAGLDAQRMADRIERVCGE